MKPILLFLCIFSICIHCSCSSQSKTSSRNEKKIFRLGIITLKQKGISDSEASSLSYRLQTVIGEIIKSKKYQNSGKDSYILVDRSKLDELLKQYDIENPASLSDSLATEVGTIYPVDRVVLGNIYLLKKTYYISARIVDVESGLIINNIHHEHKGSFESLQSRGIKDITEKLLYGKK